MGKLVSKTFLVDGSWTCPAGITSVILEGYGGGGGGGSGGTGSNTSNYYSSGGGGGGGAIQHRITVPVTPGTTYQITIPTGAIYDEDGGNVTFSDGAVDLATFIGGSKGGAGTHSDSAVNVTYGVAQGGQTINNITPFSYSYSDSVTTDANYALGKYIATIYGQYHIMPGSGGNGYTSNFSLSGIYAQNGHMSIQGQPGSPAGSDGTDNSPKFGGGAGGGGGSGPNGTGGGGGGGGGAYDSSAGGSGGAAATAVGLGESGYNGSSGEIGAANLGGAGGDGGGASPNSGAGGGGGGGAGYGTAAGTPAGGRGGSGGTGRLSVTWVI